MALTPEQLDTICDGLSSGKSLRSICKAMELPESTVRYWLKEDAAAFAHSARAKDLGYDAMADECLEIADSDEIKPDDKRIRIDTRIRLLGKWSQRYSDKTDTRHSGEIATRHDLSNLDDTELDTLERLASKATIASGDTGGEGAEKPSSVH